MMMMMMWFPELVCRARAMSLRAFRESQLHDLHVLVWSSHTYLGTHTHTFTRTHTQTHINQITSQHPLPLPHLLIILYSSIPTLHITNMSVTTCTYLIVKNAVQHPTNRQSTCTSFGNTTCTTNPDKEKL